MSRSVARRVKIQAEVHEVVESRQFIPTVHQNGFIQLPLDDAGQARLHVWPDGPITHQATWSPIHDHRFAFISTVIRGSLINTVYEVIADVNGYYRIHLADGILIPTEFRVGAVPAERQTIGIGESYRMQARVFHESEGVGLTATIMRKDPVASGAPRPRVLCPWNVPPDNEFKRDQNSPALLWGYIERAVATL